MLKGNYNSNRKKEEGRMRSYLCPPRSFDKPVVEEFLSEGQSMGEFVLEFDFCRRIPPSKPTCFDGSFNICGGHLLKLLHSHVRGHEVGEVAIDLNSVGNCF